MNLVFKSSKSTSEIQEENLPTVLTSISKASKMTKLTKYQISKHVVSWWLRNPCAAVVTGGGDGFEGRVESIIRSDVRNY